MDIGKINERYVNNTIDSTRQKVSQDSFEQRLRSAVNDKNKKELKKVCQEFEAIMLNMMYKQMKATVPKTDLVPSHAGKDIFESMLDESLVQEASKRGSFGLAEVLYKQLSRDLGSKYNLVKEGEGKIEKSK